MNPTTREKLIARAYADYYNIYATEDSRISDNDTSRSFNDKNRTLTVDNFADPDIKEINEFIQNMFPDRHARKYFLEFAAKTLKR